MSALNESNKKIAEFLGLQVFDSKSDLIINVVDSSVYQTKEKPSVLASDLRYHFDWQHLMSAVDKIETLKGEEGHIIGLDGYRFEIRRHTCSVLGIDKGRTDGIIFQTTYGKEPETRIEAVYEAVVNFIEYWNNPQEYISKKLTAA